jgi:hypothetical protein
MNQGRIAEYIVAPRIGARRLTAADDELEAWFDTKRRDKVDDREKIMAS